ncbi:MAG: hypothetical protein HKN37_12905 [Rhodothermales bacterium]|nr:hypothetical protein [Rhodothermales bacterium]
MIQEGLPTNGSHVNVAELHPELKARLRKLFEIWQGDPIQIRSGARTYEHQKQLWDAYVARGKTHPVVANPDLGLGSKHQVRPAWYQHGNLPQMEAAYAVDLMWTTGLPSRLEQVSLHEHAHEVGLMANVPSEWWHLVPTHHDPLLDIGPLDEKVLKEEIVAVRKDIQILYNRVERQRKQNVRQDRRIARLERLE